MTNNLNKENKTNTPLCKICHSKTHLIFTAKVLQKYDVSYFQCDTCKFIQTEEPYWLEESYLNAITDLDLGYVTRNLFYQGIIKEIIDKLYDKKGRFLDYGGGYGLFVRLMRDSGYNFVRQDSYCENIFAQHFDVEDFTKKDDFELLTCFEVFEHLPNPLPEIEKMLKYSNSILLSTSLQPSFPVSLETWDYIAPETGQHIAFYTKDSLSVIAKKYGMNLYSHGALHLLTSKKWNFDWLKYISFKHNLRSRLCRTYFNNKNTLLFQDVRYLKDLINKPLKKIEDESLI